MFSPGPGDALRFAARVVADPGHAVGLWKSVTGCKAVGCLPPIPVPEILHAAGLLPVSLAVRKVPRALLPLLDGWVVGPDAFSSQEPKEGRSRFGFPAVPPVGLVDALDLLESLAEWAGALSGRPVTEGGLWKSIRAYRERDHLLSLLFADTDGKRNVFPAVGGTGALAFAGDFLPAETHSLLLAQAFRIPCIPPPSSWKEEREDPLLRLARRMISKREAQKD